MRLGTRIFLSALYMACKGRVIGATRGLCLFMLLIEMARSVIASMCASGYLMHIRSHEHA